MSEYTRKPRSTRRKRAPRILLVLCLMLVVMVGSIAGTVAWLTDKTDEVKNTFTVGDINITLKETVKPDGTTVEAGVADWSAQMIPGKTYSKNPTVTVKANSVDCYLFVEVTKPANDYITYTFTLEETNSGWTQGTGTGTEGNGVPTNVWFRAVSASTSDQSWNLIKDNQVSISENLTKDKISTSSETMIFKAYAVQQAKSSTATFTAAEAWAKVSTTSNDD